MNHVDDFGGFGFMLEGFRRFQDRFSADLRGNARLLDLLLVDRALERGDVTEAEATSQREAVRKDIGTTVVRLDRGERYVVRRADGLSIYARRDLGALRVRRELLAPTDIEYVVGQEQRCDCVFLVAAGLLAIWVFRVCTPARVLVKTPGVQPEPARESHPPQSDATDSVTPAALDNTVVRRGRRWGRCD